MGVYIQLPKELKKLSNDTTSGEIKNALGYTPADAESVQNIVDDESDVFYVTDPNGNIIAKIDSEGIHTTEVNLGKEGETVVKVKEHIQDGKVHITEEERAKWNDNSSLKNITDDESNAFNITDPSGNIIATIDKDGIHTVEMTLGNENEVKVKVKEHINDTDCHVTEEEKTTWDNKSEFDGKYSSLEGIPDAATAKESLGLDQVDNTSDKDKPVSTAQQTALDNLQKTMSEQIVSESEEWHVVDKNGNIVATIDANGVNSVDVKVDGVSVKPLLNDGTEGLTYVLNEDGASMSCRGIGTATATDIRVASRVGGLPVTSISNKAFYNCGSLTSVVIPDTVTSIGYLAFNSCTNLMSMVIPDSVTTIGKNAFSDCSSLTSVVIGDGITSITEGAFTQCSSLTSVVIPDSVTTIGEYAFHSCESLTSVAIGRGVTSIGIVAFYGIRNLTKIIYSGTTVEWNAISLGENWANSPDYTIYCLDGEIAKDGTTKKYNSPSLSYVDVNIHDYYNSMTTPLESLDIPPNTIVQGYCVPIPSDIPVERIVRMSVVDGGMSDFRSQAIVSFSGNINMWGLMGITIVCYTQAVITSTITKIRVWYLP